jgi:hypothetical protein
LPHQLTHDDTWCGKTWMCVIDKTTISNWQQNSWVTSVLKDYQKYYESKIHVWHSITNYITKLVCQNNLVARESTAVVEILNAVILSKYYKQLVSIDKLKSFTILHAIPTQR